MSQPSNFLDVTTHQGRAGPPEQAPKQFEPEPVEPRAAQHPSRTSVSVRRLSEGLPYLAAVLVTAYLYRFVFSGALVGDTGDARWTVALHEHWFRVWQGKEAIRDLMYFFPLKSTLGTSDAFFLQGQIYSLLRAFEVDIAPAWQLTQILFALIGAIGVAALSSRLFRTILARTGFVVLACASYPIISDLGHIQLVGFLAVSWVVLGLCDLAAGRNMLRGAALVLLVSPLLALSSWYPTVLMMIVLAVVALYTILLSPGRPAVRRLGVLVKQGWTTIGPLRLALLVLLALGLWATVAWIYVPASRLLPAPTWSEVTLYGPRWSDILNAAFAGGGIWGFLYDRVYDPASYNYEQPRGFTPVLFVLFLAASLWQLRRGLLVGRRSESRIPGQGLPGAAMLTALWLATWTVLFLVIVDDRGLSLFRPLWARIPGLESIRAPFRVQTLLYAIALVVILRSMEMIWDRVRERVRERGVRRSWAPTAVATLALVLVAVVFVEMQRPQPNTWTSDQLLNPALVAQIPAAQRSCDAVILPVDPVGDNLVRTTVDAVTFSMLSGLPTPQGYGRDEPRDHPDFAAPPQADATWMTVNGFTGRMCTVTPTGVELISP
jgi:hypothetical protein